MRERASRGIVKEVTSKKTFLTPFLQQEKAGFALCVNFLPQNMVGFGESACAMTNGLSQRKDINVSNGSK